MFGERMCFKQKEKRIPLVGLHLEGPLWLHCGEVTANEARKEEEDLVRKPFLKSRLVADEMLSLWKQKP